MFKVHHKYVMLSALLFIICHATQAQSNFQPGYIVRPTGDTLRGQVDSRGQQRMGLVCVFRPDAKVEAKPYTPTELKAYGLRNGVRYESCQVPGGLTKAPGGAALSAAPTTLFMLQLEQGKARLYTYTDEGGNIRYFFRTTDGPVTELAQVIENVDVNFVLTQQKRYPFRRVLSQAFVDCPVVQPLLVNAELKEAELLTIFDRYNTCSPALAAQKGFEVRRVTKAQFSIVAGAQRASSTLNDNGEVELTSSLRPVFGVGLLVHPATFNPHLALRVEALYQKQLHEAQYTRQVNVASNLKGKRNAQIVEPTLRVPLLLRYQAVRGSLRPYLQLGGEVSLLLDKSKAIIEQQNQTLGSNGAYSPNNVLVEMRSYGFGFTGGVGVLKSLGSAGDLQLEVRYNQLDFAGAVPGELSGATTVSILLGYNFGQ